MKYVNLHHNADGMISRVLHRIRIFLKKAHNAVDTGIAIVARYLCSASKIPVGCDAGLLSSRLAVAGRTVYSKEKSDTFH
jgi:hypothetical protein